MSLIVKCFPSGIQSENTYVITDEATGLKAVVDPGCYGNEIKAEIGDSSLRYILLTHGHFDHFAAVQDYKEEYASVVFAAPAGESYLLHGGRDNKWLALGRGDGVCPEPDIFLKEGDIVSLGDTMLKVIETPGHTEGGICFVTDTAVFTGDTLFRASVGNTSLETGDKLALTESIRNKLYTLSEDLTVYPGHGSTTTIGLEKRSNPYVRG